VEDLEGHDNFFVLGRGMSYPVAAEGALKLKEIARVHAEAYPASSLKHGPYAVITPGFPVILCIFNDENAKDLGNQLAQLHSRHAKTIVITNDRRAFDNSKASHIIDIPIGDGILE
jgi:glucosamine--fructose-6-phosphate aminotransferase (isomerizing)